MITQEYKYEGEEFVITKPEACAMNVSRGEYTATISIHSATNQFRESLAHISHINPAGRAVFSNKTI